VTKEERGKKTTYYYWKREWERRRKGKSPSFPSGEGVGGSSQGKIVVCRGEKGKKRGVVPHLPKNRRRSGAKRSADLCREHKKKNGRKKGKAQNIVPKRKKGGKQKKILMMMGWDPRTGKEKRKKLLTSKRKR